MPVLVASRPSTPCRSEIRPTPRRHSSAIPPTIVVQRAGECNPPLQISRGPAPCLNNPGGGSIGTIRKEGDVSHNGTNMQVLLRSRPHGIPQTSNFEIVETPIPEPAEGQILCRTIY